MLVPLSATAEFLVFGPKLHPCCRFSNPGGRSMYLRRLPLLWCMALIALTLIPRSFGQAVTATLVGTVSDKTGAAIENAKVTIIEQQTGATLAQSTNTSGNYEFTLLPPGIYTVSVE